MLINKKKVCAYLHAAIKNYNGQVKTEQRNIFSGVTASGILKKCYFHYETSVYQGDPYIDPGKH
jgi:hypothetical protein